MKGINMNAISGLSASTGSLADLRALKESKNQQTQETEETKNEEKAKASDDEVKAFLETIDTTGEDEESTVEDTSKTKATNAVKKTSTNNTTAASDDAEAIQAKIDELEEERQANLLEIQNLNAKIQAEEAKIQNAIDEAESLSEEVKNSADSAVQEIIEQYKSGELTQEELGAVMMEKLGEIIDDDTLAQLQTTIESSSANIANYQSQIDALVERNKEIDIDLTKYDKQLKNAQAKAQVAANSSNNSDNSSGQCEPQGFQVKNADGTITQYDFFVDRDKNGLLSDMTEFLGAVTDAAGKDGWLEMQAYDLNKDGTININEMLSGNKQNINGGELKAVVTTINANGERTQELKSLEDAFGKDSDLTINAQKNANIQNTVAPAGFNDTKYNNDILGNFNVKLNGKNIVGYQTDDDVKYLNDYYKFSSGNALGNSSQNEIIPMASAYNSGAVNQDIASEKFKNILDGIYRNIDNASQSASNELSGISPKSKQQDTNKNANEESQQNQKKKVEMNKNI